ncbi:hypothetical protein CIK05_04265 [Bdellovibrio sp. qaytius]|nr:hypothetical protein CIK05_04265 [Bdellovibrio sp. qaytius]
MIKKLKDSIKAQLTQGATPEKLAQSLSVGMLIGCFPLIGFATGLAALFGVVFKLNHIVVQTANYMMYPVQIVLIPIYIKVISLMIDVGDVPIRPDLILEAFRADWMQFLKTYSLIGLYAVILWIIVSGILFMFLPKLFLPAIKKLNSFKG